MPDTQTVIAIALYRMTDPADGEVYTKAFCKEITREKFDRIAQDEDAVFSTFHDEIDEEWELSNGLRFELLKLTF